MEGRQSFRAPTHRVLVGTRAPGGFHLCSPVDLGNELGGGDQFLGGIALVAAVHVRRGNRDEMGQGLPGASDLCPVRGQARSASPRLG